ncbi:MAG: pyridoxal phosphate-dependent aminotransferase [Candidatus Omnitrophota bacterium]
MRIETRVAERLKKIHPSLTLAITAKAKQLKSEGYDVVSLAAGEPDFDTPDFIKAAGIEAINSGFTKYTPSTGILELRQAIAAKLVKDNCLEYNPSQIVVSCGAKHSIFNAIFALVGHSDEVLIPSPYWVSYPEMVNLCQGRTRFIKTSARNSFKLTSEELSQHITPKTKLLILNSPSNPSGCVYSRKELEEIAVVCIEKKIFVISDEIYEKLTYDNLKHVSLGSLNKDIYDQTITVNGLSKSFSMTGWRIGYLAGPQDIVDAVSKIQDHTTSNPVSISQKAALAAFSAQEDFVKDMLKEFQKRRDYAVKMLSGIKKIDFIKPQGAFYIFCGIVNTGLGSADFASRLLEEALVGLIPGEGFGRDDYVRISFATSLSQLEKGMDRLKEWIDKL